MLDDVLLDVNPAKAAEILKEAWGILVETQLVIKAFNLPSSSWLSPVCESTYRTRHQNTASELTSDLDSLVE